MPDVTKLPWRIGRHVPIHLYAQLGPEPSNDDVPLGTMLTAEAAQEAVETHNARLGTLNG